MPLVLSESWSSECAWLRWNVSHARIIFHHPISTNGHPPKHRQCHKLMNHIIPSADNFQFSSSHSGWRKDSPVWFVPYRTSNAKVFSSLIDFCFYWQFPLSDPGNMLLLIIGRAVSLYRSQSLKRNSRDLFQNSGWEPCKKKTLNLSYADSFRCLLSRPRFSIHDREKTIHLYKIRKGLVNRGSVLQS